MTGETGPIRVLIADRYGLFREAVHAALENLAGAEVVAEARTGDEAVRQSNRTTPDLVIIGAGLTGCDGIEATRRIKRALPRCKVLVLADRAEPHHLIEALEAGADGYLTKESSLLQLLTSIGEVSAGETVIPRGTLRPILDRLMRGRVPASGPRLTTREREIVRLLIRQADKESIARSLVASTDTVRTHLNNILGKLGVGSHADELFEAQQQGLHTVGVAN